MAYVKKHSILPILFLGILTLLIFVGFIGFVLPEVLNNPKFKACLFAWGYPVIVIGRGIKHETHSDPLPRGGEHTTTFVRVERVLKGAETPPFVVYQIGSPEDVLYCCLPLDEPLLFHLYLTPHRDEVTDDVHFYAENVTVSSINPIGMVRFLGEEMALETLTWCIPD